ncbi:hypothetical protein GGS20DRAFT_539360 [Poronia punctata]|nr:hypothetical protein GGS20DRAFT_539360 [Poronia punctata]
MSVPPQIIRVKRKATEEGPVSYLRLQESKRHRSGVFVYQRQDAHVDTAQNTPVPKNQTPVIHTSAQADRATNVRDASKQNTHRLPQEHVAQTAHETTVDGTYSPDSVSASASEPRRFHMSRKDMMLASVPHPSRAHGGISKKRSVAALFVERRIRQVSPRLVEKFHSANNATPTPTPTQDSAADDAMEVDKPEPRKFKKPGVSRLSGKNGQPKQKPELPKSMTNRWHVDMEKLAMDMDAYAMQQIGFNLQKAEEEKHMQDSPSKLKFKPKPTKRYAERHPEEAQQSVDQDMVDAGDEKSDSDDDYIIDTYIRVPASSMGDHVPPQKVGLLVFDEEPDIEFFYGGEEESEDEWAEDEEDENAENYYTADYPDEEVDTDDEFDKNAYAFRTRNASDLEEYDVGGESDDSPWDVEDEATTSQFRTYIGRNGLKTNHL